MASASSTAPMPSEPPVTVGPPVVESWLLGRRLLRFVWATPPWTVSFVVHLSALIVLGLLFIDEHLLIETALTAYQALPSEAQEMVAPETVQMQAVEALQLDALTSESVSAELSSASAVPGVTAEELDPDAIINVSTVDSMPSQATLFYAVPIKRQKTQPVQPGRQPATQREIQMAEAAERGEAAFGEQLNDQIVYRFILWDICLLYTSPSPRDS